MAFLARQSLPVRRRDLRVNGLDYVPEPYQPATGYLTYQGLGSQWLTLRKNVDG
ncbi:MAG: hypothetical protein HY320_08555 [Armatimonadetes bacterium]|nr:hypothetical protein [Armatimonadota bacterium]